MNLLVSFKKILRENKASAALEFAFVFPIYFFLLMGFVEFGIMMYGNALLDSSLTRASRRAMVGCMEGECDEQNIINDILEELRRSSFGFIGNQNDALGSNLKVSITTLGSGENYIEDMEDISGLNLGNGGDIVSYCLKYDWNDFFPITPAKLIYGFPEGVMTFRTCTVVRNEEFGYQIRGL